MKKLFSTIFLLWCLASQCQGKHSFSFADSVFLLDGKPFQVISGEIHYPRVPREEWRLRMKAAKAMGLNTVSTYVFWNLHEPQKDVFDFSNNNDMAAFVKAAEAEGLWVILRPSPYVCAEWEFGGYPYWLQNEEGLQVRSKEKKYLEEYRKYILEIGRQLAPLQINHGGNILMVQVENEYGSYGSDKEYLDINRKIFVDAGFDGLLFTCDPAKDVEKGMLNGLLPTVNGLDKPGEVKALVRKNNNGKGPFLIAEWYPAWFDWWATKHHTVPAEKYAPRLDSVLAAGISINMYMFHGGTTRGYMNGANANKDRQYEAQISSYDYDAPLDEAGNPTHKYLLFRSVIEKHLPKGTKLPPVPRPKPSIAISSISLSVKAGMLSNLPAPVSATTPKTFEELNQPYGFVLYRTAMRGGESGTLRLDELRDYAIVLVDGKRVGVLERRLNTDSLTITFPPGDQVILDIIVENQGRINYGPNLLRNKKGITKAVYWNGAEIKGWQVYSLPFEKAPELNNPKATGNGPVIRKGTFELKQTGDTYLDMSEWGKGCVWVNGHHLGRYWSVGPQQTVYVPGCWLKKGKNEIVVLELLKPEQTSLRAIKTAILDKLQGD
jgi:beta-galactosidase